MRDRLRAGAAAIRTTRARRGVRVARPRDDVDAVPRGGRCGSTRVRAECNARRVRVAAVGSLVIRSDAIFHREIRWRDAIFTVRVRSLRSPRRQNLARVPVAPTPRARCPAAPRIPPTRAAKTSSSPPSPRARPRRWSASPPESSSSAKLRKPLAATPPFYRACSTRRGCSKTRRLRSSTTPSTRASPSPITRRGTGTSTSFPCGA